MTLGIATIDDVVIAWFFRADIAVVVNLRPESDLPEVSLVVVSAIDDVIALVGGVSMFLLPFLSC